MGVPLCLLLPIYSVGPSVYYYNSIVCLWAHFSWDPFYFFFFQRIYNHGSRRLTLVNTVSSPCLSLGGWKEILKNCSLMRITIFAIRRGEGCILGEAFTWGDLLFFLNIFVFVILWSFVKEQQILIKIP